MMDFFMPMVPFVLIIILVVMFIAAFKKGWDDRAEIQKEAYDFKQKQKAFYESNTPSKRED